jgi:hypothetical protein
MSKVFFILESFLKELQKEKLSGTYLYCLQPNSALDNRTELSCPFIMQLVGWFVWSGCSLACLVSLACCALLWLNGWMDGWMVD